MNCHAPCAAHHGAWIKRIIGRNLCALGLAPRALWGYHLVSERAPEGPDGKSRTEKQATMSGFGNKPPSVGYGDLVSFTEMWPAESSLTSRETTLL